MNDWEQKQLEKADKFEKLAAAERKRADDIARSAAYSPARFRQMRKAEENATKYERRAKNARNPRRIDSADPNAIEKLRVKLNAAEVYQKQMKAANKIIRGTGEPAEKFQQVRAMGFHPDTAHRVVYPQFGRPGFRWDLKNNGAEIRRLKKRISDLETVQEQHQPAAAALMDELEAAKQYHEQMTAGNRIIMNHHITKAERVAQIVALGIPEEQAKAAVTPAHGRPGFQLRQTQNGEKIADLEKQIADLEKQQAHPTAEDRGNGIRVLRNADAYRIQVFFPGKPCYAVRATMKRNGFRWAPSISAWQRHLNPAGENALALALPRVKQQIAELGDNWLE